MKKSRQVRHTIFIYCEGKTDHLFVQYLKRLYLLRGTKQVDPRKGRGGGLSTFISDIIGNAQVRDYDEKYIVLDSDDKKEEELKESQTESQKYNIQLIWQKPCLEGVFLRILKGDQFIKETSESCKAIFKREYMPDNTSLTESLLEKLFTKNILNTKRKKVSELNQLIQLMEAEKVK